MMIQERGTRNSRVIASLTSGKCDGLIVNFNYKTDVNGRYPRFNLNKKSFGRKRDGRKEAVG